MMDWQKEQLKVATGVTDGSHSPEYERGFIDGMQEQMRRSVDRAVNAMTREWVGLTEDEFNTITNTMMISVWDVARAVEAKLKEKNA